MHFPGSILMTSNCLIQPKAVYKNRLFTTSCVGWDGVKHIEGQDYSEIINMA